MSVQFTPPRDTDDQEEIDRLRTARAAPIEDLLRADPRTLSQEQCDRIGRQAFRWFFIRVFFWTPLIATVALPAGGLAGLIVAAGVFGSQGPGMPWFIGVCAGIAAACYVVRILGGMAAFRGPLHLRRGGAPRNLIEATAGGIFNGLSSLYCTYVVAFYGVGILLLVALLSGPSGPYVIGAG